MISTLILLSRYSISLDVNTHIVSVLISFSFSIDLLFDWTFSFLFQVCSDSDSEKHTKKHHSKKHSKHHHHHHKHQKCEVEEKYESNHHNIPNCQPNCQQNCPISFENCFPKPVYPLNYPKYSPSSFPGVGFPTVRGSYPQVVPTTYTLGFPQSTFVDCEHKSIYFCDSDAQAGTPSIFRYDICSGILYGATVANTSAGLYASGCIPYKGCNGQFICNIGSCICRVYWDGRSTTAYKTSEIYCFDPNSGLGPDWALSSPNGKYYFSAYRNGECSVNKTGLYEYDPRTGLTINRITDVSWTNGFCWNPCNNDFYLIDECRDSFVGAYYWNPISGSLSKQIF